MKAKNCKNPRGFTQIASCKAQGKIKRTGGKYKGKKKATGGAVKFSKGGTVMVQARGCGAMMNDRRKKTKMPRS